jgi:Ca2+-binding RTX toxin-like protein
MQRIAAVTVLIASVLVLCAAPAGANYTGSADAGTGVVTLTGDDASDKLTVRRNAGGQILFDVGDDGTTEDLTPGFTPTVANVAEIVVNCGGGDDQVRVDESNGALPRFRMEGGAGTDVLTGGSGNDVMRGGEGNDTLLGKGGGDDVTGGAGDDTITPGDGDDVAGGDAGSDKFIWNPGDDTDNVEGGEGDDTQEINAGNGAETFDVARSGDRVVLARITPAPITVNAGSVENATVHANGGDDIVTGHSGLKDLIKLTLDGGAGDDNLTGGDGDDRFLWAPAQTTIQDTIDGADGSDTLQIEGDGSAEGYELTGATTSVVATRNGTQPNATDRVETIAINGHDGDDLVRVADSVADRAALDTDLGPGDDVAIGGAAGDRLVGGPGEDTLLGRGGDDFLFGDAGTDELIGGAGADHISCGGLGDHFAEDSADTIAADCRPAPEPGPQQPAGGDQPGPGGGPQGPQGPTADAGVPAGFRGFSRPKVKGTLGTLSVTVANTHTAPITVSVGATESKSRYRAIKKTIAPGATATFKLKTPSKLRKALTRKLKTRPKVKRAARVSVTNVATGGKSTVTAHLTARR